MMYPLSSLTLLVSASSLITVATCFSFSTPHKSPLAPSLALLSQSKSHVPLSQSQSPQSQSSALQASSIPGIPNLDPQLSPGIQIINQHNPTLHTSLSQLRSIPYFRYYSVDMLASCEYIPQELFECYSQTCEIYPVDEYDDDDQPIIPQAIRTVDIQEFDFDIDGWARWDMPSEDYYDIVEFKEEFTNYDGSEVWNFIHTKIAFENDIDGQDAESWKMDFNKAVSGMHSMISAHIIKGIEDKIENEEEFDEDCQWTDPVVEYKRRIGSNGNTPDALQNMYFTFMLLLSAVQSIRTYLLSNKSGFGCDENDTECDIRVNSALQNILSSPLFTSDGNIGESINVASNNLHKHAIRDEQSKHNLWEARMRSRELLRIMNCVQCNKCRLHGKIAAMGLSTAWQLLLGTSGDGMELSNQSEFQKIHRVELSALLTTLEKFSTAIQFCVDMEEKIESA